MLIRQGARGEYKHRDISIQVNPSSYADGSCLLRMGRTHVMCTASLDQNEKADPSKGDLTAEYGILSTAHAKPVLRTAEIQAQESQAQQLIQRSLSSCLDLEALNGHKIRMNCEVLQDDGSTRGASLTAGCVAVCLALRKYNGFPMFSRYPLLCRIVGVSFGMLKGQLLLDLDREETQKAEIYGLVVFNSDGQMLHLEISGNTCSFDLQHVSKLVDMALQGARGLFRIQKQAVEREPDTHSDSHQMVF